MFSSRSAPTSAAVLLSLFSVAWGKPPGDRCDPLPVQARARLGTMRFRHVGLNGRPTDVESLVPSRGGSILASLGKDGSVCTWDAASGRRLRQFGLSAPCHGELTVSPDGKWVAAGGGLWDATTGTQPSHSVGLAYASFSADGKAALLDLDRSACAAHPHTGKILSTFRKKSAAYLRDPVLFAPEGRTLIAAYRTAQAEAVVFRDVASGKEVRRIQAGRDYFQGLLPCSVARRPASGHGRQSHPAVGHCHGTKNTAHCRTAERT